jgi:hypothetical protein
VTVAVGIAVFFILPSLPSKTRWLSEEQRRLAVWRMTGDAAGEADEGGDQSIKTGIRLVMKDWKVIYAFNHWKPADLLTDYSAYLPTNVYQLRSEFYLLLRKLFQL